jgi:hypothetical protein
MIIPLHNTQGWQVPGVVQRRPHRPTAGPDGRVRKYLLKAGSHMQVDVPPLSLPSLTDPHVPIIITESALKADAILSVIEPGTFCVISVAGVYGWRSQGMPLPDFGDIPFLTKARDRITHRRRVIPLFDSDAATNPNVTRARWELGKFLGRKGARVDPVDIPPAPDGGKQGIDDFLAAGGNLHKLLASAYPLPDIMPVLEGATPADNADAPELERLRTENVQLRRLNSAQAELLRNPTLKDKPRMVGFATITEAAAMVSRGEVDPDGYVHLDVARIVNDYRPRPAKGEAIPETNPQDESLPLTSRNNAKTALNLLIEHKAIDARFAVTKRKAASGDWYADTELVVKVTDMPAAIIRLASFDGRKARKAYTRQAECPSCGEVHARSVRTFHESTCMGCGTPITTEEPTRIIPVPVAQDPDATEEQRDTLRERDLPTPMVATEKSASTKNREASNGDSELPPEAPNTYVSTKNREAGDSPAFVAEDSPSTKNVEAPPAETNTCVHCHQPTPNKYRCDPCIAEYESRSC